MLQLKYEVVVEAAMNKLHTSGRQNVKYEKYDLNSLELKKKSSLGGHLGSTS